MRLRKQSADGDKNCRFGRLLGRTESFRPHSLSECRCNDGENPQNNPAAAKGPAAFEKLAYFAAWHTICLENGEDHDET